MNTKLICHAVVASTITTSAVFAQGGSLTPPPGDPSPTMKTLDLIEPRRPLVEGTPGVGILPQGTITISQSGSYYLTGNVEISENVNGIIVNANGVNLDLSGHSISYTGSGTAGKAIEIQGDNVHVRDGHIVSTTVTSGGGNFTNGGFIFGVNSSHNAIVVREVSITGVTSGIYLSGAACLVEGCAISVSSNIGIYMHKGLVRGCVVEITGGDAINATVVTDSQVDQAYGNGIYASIVESSYASSLGPNKYGIYANVASNSYAYSELSSAIYASAGVCGSRGYSASKSLGSNGIYCSTGTVVGCYGGGAGGRGILAASVSESTGRSSGANGSLSSGITADIVTNSHGTAFDSLGGYGIHGYYTVAGSYGKSYGVQGIYSEYGTVTDSYGYSDGNQTGSCGIQAQVVANCQGRSGDSGGSDGIRADTLVMNSSGVSEGGHGIHATRSASNCYGYTGADTTSSHGIHSNGTVTGSYGYGNGSGGGDGINAVVVTNSYGYANTDARHGINAGIVDASQGHRPSVVTGKYGLNANRASLSRGVNGENITYKYNMP